ncbi:MAG: hypothetical protein QG652_1267 [Pseudomonadota bacterium]|nr:hypothetical protein [Pseudomonadota bacterium]
MPTIILAGIAHPTNRNTQTKHIRKVFAFICVMHMDVRMLWAQDAQEQRNLRFLLIHDCRS